MAGCFGGSDIDRWIESQLDAHLSDDGQRWWCDKCDRHSLEEEWGETVLPDDEQEQSQDGCVYDCPLCGHRHYHVPHVFTGYDN